MTPRQYRVTRDVTADEPGNHMLRDVKAGETFEAFTGATWGCVDEDNEIALDTGRSGFGTLPLDAVEPLF